MIIGSDKYLQYPPDTVQTNMYLPPIEKYEYIFQGGKSQERFCLPENEKKTFMAYLKPMR